ncbi:hypothetical protein ABIA33_007633 [Streptacidiphilus sp. MAP12-16]|uniref:hypothetical protein n=1 Tax=Streptacidiphilus sp. MAP12-16 TaxID=3156300 RepID=UPI0035134C83
MTSTAPEALGPYPVAQPATGEDARFSLGLIFDVARRIEAAGYPQITSGRDLVRLMGALYGFCYGEDE